MAVIWGSIEEKRAAFCHVMKVAEEWKSVKWQVVYINKMVIHG